MVLDVKQSALNAIHKKNPDILIVKNVDFVVFIAQVINCTSHCEGGK